ncbi:MAG: FAD-binding oxidoreductase [bacterium]|nr:FAD-binding oxidoreductase [bacterium]
MGDEPREPKVRIAFRLGACTSYPGTSTADLCDERDNGGPRTQLGAGRVASTYAPSMVYADALVIGGGIAGVSVGHYLAQAGRTVTLVEQEPQLASHTTGRSAAVLYESYGTRANQRLTKASLDFFRSPPEALVDVPLVARRGVLLVARPSQMESLRAEASHGVGLLPISTSEVRSMVPVMRTELLGGALLEPQAADLDVAGLHQAFVRGMLRSGATIRTSSPVEALTRSHGCWKVRTPGEVITAPVVVNAAGAWCDLVAEMAGVEPIGLTPLRRTAFMVPGRPEWSEWPAVVDVDQRWYFKPDGEQLLCSPAEEQPSPPCDARPLEVDIALAIDRINRATSLGIRTVRSSWTGLRSFVADRSMVIGFDGTADGFFWLAGQGGTGIQTSPGAGRLAASLIVHGQPPDDHLQIGVRPEDYSPDRLR